MDSHFHGNDRRDIVIYFWKKRGFLNSFVECIIEYWISAFAGMTGGSAGMIERTQKYYS